MSLNPVNGLSNSNDTVVGTAADDRVDGKSGNDVISGGKGADLLIGGSGNDVMTGGSGADTFQWSAGHITSGAVDYVTDFDIRLGDKLSFLNSASGNIEIVGVSKTYVTETMANGVDLSNNVATGTDLVFTIRNSATHAEQTIVLLDAWSGKMNDQWVDYLATFGITSFS